MLSGKLSRRRTTRRKREFSGRRSLESTTGVTVFAEVNDTFAQTALMGGELAQPGAMRASDEGECEIVATSVACFAALATENICGAHHNNKSQPIYRITRASSRQEVTHGWAALHYQRLGCRGGRLRSLQRCAPELRGAWSSGPPRSRGSRVHRQQWPCVRSARWTAQQSVGQCCILSPSAVPAHIPTHVRNALASEPLEGLGGEAPGVLQRHAGCPGGLEHGVHAHDRQGVARGDLQLTGRGQGGPAVRRGRVGTFPQPLSGCALTAQDTLLSPAFGGTPSVVRSHEGSLLGSWTMPLASTP